MDPELRELLETVEPDEEVELLLRVRPGRHLPPQLRVISRFGDVVTGRVRRADVPLVYADAAIASMKPPSDVVLEPRTVTDLPPDEAVRPRTTVRPTDQRRPDGLRETGRGVVIAVIDWGFDLTHPDLRRPDGSTRVLALWDQGGTGPPPHPFSYGTVHDRTAIDAAFRARDPFATLGYRVGTSQPAHGTHVTGIAAGNGRGGGPTGLAPDADLVLIHLARHGGRGTQNLGNSVRILEAVDFAMRTAGSRPCVVNLSVGAHGGPHDGSTLLERGLDNAVRSRRGRAVCQSTGNYYAARIHTQRRLRSGEVWHLPWDISPGDPTTNELEVWYPGSDRLIATVIDPDGRRLATARLDETRDLTVGGARVGRLYHRARDPNNGDHLIDVFLYPESDDGRWTVEVTGERIRDGRCHAWIERDSRRPASAQSRFPGPVSSSAVTLGTVANGRGPITVAAFDPHRRDRSIGGFSSAGPTRDGRRKPDIAAPGVASLAADSTWATSGRLNTRMSGTSMAAPVVTGTVALMFEASRGQLSMRDVRRLLLGTADRSEREPRLRYGHGRVDVTAAVRRARRSAGTRGTAPVPTRPPTPTTPPPPPEVEAIPSVPPPPPPALDAWRGLLSFVPPPAVLSAAGVRVPGLRLHPIERGYGPVNLDLYPVVVRTLPRGTSAPALLDHVRRNLNRLIDTRISRFLPYDAGSATVWGSTAPIGAVMHIDMYVSVLGRPVKVDSGSVVCAQAAPDNWIFSTVYTPGDLGHPVSGNRMFGFVRRGGVHVFFTMAADRLTSLLDFGGEWGLGRTFVTADQLWRSLQLGIARYVRAGGGRATIARPISTRFDWGPTQRLYRGAPVTAVRTTLP